MDDFAPGGEGGLLSQPVASVDPDGGVVRGDVQPSLT